MLNIRYRNQTNVWPGFVDLFSNLVIILIFLLIMFVFLWTTTSIFNKQSGAKTVADLKQANAEQAQTIEEMETYKREANRLLMLAHDELVNVDNSTEDLITAYENKIAEKQAEIDALTEQLNQTTLIAEQATINAEQSAILEQERKALQEQIGVQTAELNARLAQLQAALDAAEEKSRAQEIEYVEMSTRLNKALADKVAELNDTVAKLNDVSKYQSDFLCYLQSGQ